MSKNMTQSRSGVIAPYGPRQETPRVASQGPGVAPTGFTPGPPVGSPKTAIPGPLEECPGRTLEISAAPEFALWFQNRLLCRKRLDPKAV